MQGRVGHAGGHVLPGDDQVRGGYVQVQVGCQAADGQPLGEGRAGSRVEFEELRIHLYSGFCYLGGLNFDFRFFFYLYVSVFPESFCRDSRFGSIRKFIIKK